MKLSDLLIYDEVVIQCHDNPDADALASAYGVYLYLKGEGKSARIIYGGKYKLQKSNLLIMIRELDIPIEYVDNIEKPKLLLTVDCQYGQGNVAGFEAENIAVIDHHQVTGKLPELSEVRSNLGSCSTLVRELLGQEGFDINSDSKLATALYYGLLTDTNNFAEIRHPLDMDLRDEAKYENSLITIFKNSNLSLTELGIAGEALMGYRYNEAHRFAIVQAKPCDPNILGMISDLTLEVDTVETCIVYSVLPFGIKFSIRSCVKEVKASELADYVAADIGSGGGHIGKAGGFLQRELLEKSLDYEDPYELERFLNQRMVSYFSGVDIIYAEKYQADVSGCQVYRKRNLPIGCVKGSDILPVGTSVVVRTLEGDLHMDIEEDIYIMIGIKGEVYPIRKEKFDRSYQLLDGEYAFEGEYEPHVKDTLSGNKISLIPAAKCCVPTGEVKIYARPLSKRVKVFTAWDKEHYMSGKVQDYLAVRFDDAHDIYVIEKDIFTKTYELI